MAIDKDILKALQDLTKQLKGDSSRSGGRRPRQQGGSDLDSLMGEALGTEEAERLNRELEIAKESARDMREFRREEARIMGEINDSASALRAKRDAEIAQAKIALKTAEDTLDNEQATLDYLQQQLDIDAQRLGVAVDILAANDADFQAAQERVRLALEHRNAQSGVTEELHKSRDAAEELEDATESVLNQMGLSGKGWEKSFFGKLEKLGASKTFQSMGTQISSALKPANLVGAAMTQLVQASVQAVGARDRNIASFNKATGAGGKYNQVIEQTYKRTDGLAIAHEDAAAAVQDLTMGFGGFAKLTEQTQADLGQLVAGFENLGMSGAESVEFLDTAVKSLGMSVPEAQEALKETANTAANLGIPVAKFTKDLKATMPTLSAFGNRAMDVFTETAAVADALGMSTSELVNTMERFTTFRGAAESAGKLNAMLGGTINSMELVAASAKGPAETLKVLRRGIDASGKSFQDLGVFGKKAIADALGVDVEQAGKMMSMSAEEIADAQKKAEQATKDKADMDKTLNEMMKAAIPSAKQFAEIFNQMAPFIEVVINGLRAVVEPLIKIAQEAPEVIYGIMGIVAAFKILAAFRGVQTLLVGTNAAMVATGPAAAGAGPGLTSLAGGLTANIVPAAALTVTFGKFALFASGLALSIAAMAVGFALMFEAIDLEKALALGIFIGGLALAAPALVVAGAGLIMMGVGMAVLGLALKLVATADLEALGTIMSSEGKGIDQLIKLPGAFRDSLKTMETLSEGLGKLNGALAQTTMAGVLTGMSVGVVFEKIGDLSSVTPDGVESIKQTTNMIKAVTSLDSSAVEQAETLLNHATNFMTAAGKAGETGTTTGMLEKLTKLLSGEKSSGSTATSSNNRPVVLAMDAAGRKIMARGIINDIMPLVNQKLDTRVE